MNQIESANNAIPIDRYRSFVSGKLGTVPATGISNGFSVPSSLFPHQSALVAWALRRGRAAIFADTGLGKSRMQLAWADAVQRHTKGRVLILAPLAVAAQTVGEGLTALESSTQFGITSLHRRLTELRELGRVIESKPEKSSTANYRRYYATAVPSRLRKELGGC